MSEENIDGYCEDCGNWDELVLINGSYLCEHCADAALDELSGD